MEKLSVKTTAHCQMVDVTEDVRELVASCPWRQGAVVIFSPHTTCGVTINEGADPDACRHMSGGVARPGRRSQEFRHAEGNSDAHIKASLFGSSVTIPVEDGELCLGTWQSIYACEGDGPRVRQLWVQFLPGLDN